MDQNETEKKVDRFNVRCFNHETLKKRIDHLAKIRKISSNLLILNILEEYLERNEMKTYSKRYILEKPYNSNKMEKITVAILTIGIIFLSISLIMNTFLFPIWIIHFFINVGTIFSLSACPYIFWYFLSEIYIECYTERILKKNNIKIYKIYEINPKEAIITKKLKIGEIYRFNPKMDCEVTFKTEGITKMYYLFDNYIFFSD